MLDDLLNRDIIAGGAGGSCVGLLTVEKAEMTSLLLQYLEAVVHNLWMATGRHVSREG